MSLLSPALAGRFFTNCATWEVHYYIEMVLTVIHVKPLWLNSACGGGRARSFYITYALSGSYMPSNCLKTYFLFFLSYKIFLFYLFFPIIFISWRLIALQYCRLLFLKNQRQRDFPGGPVFKISPSNAGGAGSIPGQGAKVPHAVWPKKLKHKTRSIIVTNLIKTLTMVHIKKNLLKPNKRWGVESTEDIERLREGSYFPVSPFLLLSKALSCVFPTLQIPLSLLSGLPSLLHLCLSLMPSGDFIFHQVIKLCIKEHY